MDTSSLISVVIVARMPSKGISGGRYFTLIMAEALAAQELNVCLWVNCRPEFFDEFKHCPGHKKITFHVDPNFSRPPEFNADLVIVAPHRAVRDEMYFSAIHYTQRVEALLALINFETPDWFNSLSPETLSENLWGGWRLCAQYADGIISIAEEGDRWARSYYDRYTSNIVFSFAYPPVNEYALRQSTSIDSAQTKIVCITRFSGSSSHKGSLELAAAINERWKGRALSIICGHPPEGDAWQQILRAVERYGVNLKLHCRISEVEKFKLLREASLLVFLTRFEGYGYPPVEALWAQTPVLCSNLPVLREITRGQAHFVKLSGDVNLGDEIEEALDQQTFEPTKIQKVMDETSLEAFGLKIAQIYEQMGKCGRPKSTMFIKRFSFKVRHVIGGFLKPGAFVRFCFGKLRRIVGKYGNFGLD